MLAALKAPSATRGRPLFVAGAVIALLGLAVVVFSCLAWVTISLPKRAVDSFTVSGLGSVSLDSGGQVWEEAQRAQMESHLEDLTVAAGGWTLVFGVLAILGAVPLLRRRAQGLGALGAFAAGAAATISAGVAVTTSGAGVIDPGAFGGSFHASSDFGLWGVLSGSIALVIVGACAAALAVIPGRRGALPRQ